MSTYAAISDLSFLLVEPSDMQRKVITKALEEAGIKQIAYANNIQETIESLSSFPPDLVISSMYLPDGSANDLIDRIRNNEETENQCFMLISSERNRDHLEHLRQSGVLAILPKPFNQKDLTRAIHATLDLIVEEEIDLEMFDPKSLRVLVTDDSRMARKHVSKTLNTMGIEDIQFAENGKEAIALLNEMEFDLIVTDYNMPEMDGRELTEAVRLDPALAHIPILMVSSNSEDSQLSNIAQEGVDAICGKPFEPSVVRKLLAKILN
ncbi:MAG: response regulator [Gammaproteobacteria bacterium]|jgi:two-component system chemotaxis response regulator CheY|uniref:Two-component system, chemotaxis family, response regulator CheY n=1 Tax=Marinomonas polaris DSM 16579 TaxID=1122206 RepID=A0A1M5GC30_9GAMM|nr:MULTISPECIES: response regulator [Marinomonas]MBU1296536.1 response regulator [Gammaproteobacteria bacterium]MBU1465665.1 response regulator [Gammaproteobacteria bacterium]MBU2023168.1 response regulator [Gammaproteobacteria bacterium]MBU2236384.1 response regulator [Gammaproteobacteria bacterium]MBU2318363.1 response regulator [Gammaproteobacteria bacterium]